MVGQVQSAAQALPPLVGVGGAGQSRQCGRAGTVLHSIAPDGGPVVHRGCHGSRDLAWAVSDPLSGFIWCQCRHFQPGLAESIRVGRVGSPAAPIFGLDTADIQQLINQSSIAIGRLGGDLGLLSLDRQLGRQVFHLLAQSRIATGIKQVPRLLDVAGCLVPVA